METPPPADSARDRLRAALKSKGWTRKRFAREADLNRDTVESWFWQNDRVPDGRQLRRIAETTRLRPTWLLTGEGPEWIGQSRKEATPAEDMNAALAVRLGPMASVILPSPDMLLQSVLEEFTGQYERKIEEAVAEANRREQVKQGMIAQLPQSQRQLGDLDELAYLQSKHGFEQGHANLQRAARSRPLPSLRSLASGSSCQLVLGGRASLKGWR